MADPDSSSRNINLTNKNDNVAARSPNIFSHLYNTCKTYVTKFLTKKIKTREQLLDTLKNSTDKDVLSSEAINMIDGVLYVSDMQVRDIMIPRSQMIVIDVDCEIEEFLPVMISSGHSRFPVVGENRDEVLGTILAKDLLPYIIPKDKSSKVNIKELIRPVMIVPESKRLNILLKEFRISRQHMAIVADEYGGISGLATIEDVLEQIVGNIEDEYDIQASANITKAGNNVFNVQALTPIEEFNEYFDVNFSDEEFDTIGGVILNNFGYLPVKNETTTIENFKIKILNADKRRIKLIKIIKLPEVSPN